MRSEPYTNKDGYRIWLNKSEQQQLINHFEEDPQKELVIRLGLHGLRSDEITRVCKNHVRQLDTEDEQYVLIIPTSKTGYRETPIDIDTKKQIQMISNLQNKNKDDPVVDVTTRTIQRWVNEAASQLAQETGNDDWSYVTTHDLRRTWATQTYWSISGSRAKDIVMSWGGWVDEQTFTSNYLGTPTDDVTATIAGEAGLV